MRKIDEAHGTLVAGEGNAAYNEARQPSLAPTARTTSPTLYREARRTPTSADEAIVRRIETLDGQAPARQIPRSPIFGGRRVTLPAAASTSSRRATGSGVPATITPTPPSATERDCRNAQEHTRGGAGGLLWDLLRGGYGSRPTRGGADFGSPSFPFPFPMPGGTTTDSAGGNWRNPSSRGGWSPNPEPQEDRSRSDGGDFSTGGLFDVTRGPNIPLREAADARRASPRHPGRAKHSSVGAHAALSACSKRSCRRRSTSLAATAGLK